jgi:glutaminyl-tRNA synthetase
LGYFTVDKDSTASKLVFNKTVGLKDAWEEKGKKEENLLMNTQKDINKFVKEKDETAAQPLLNAVVATIQSIDNFSLLCQTVIKNIKNDNNSLLFANLILHFSEKITLSDIDSDSLTKLFTMSLKSPLASVRIYAIQNLQKQDFYNAQFKETLSELKNVEKNETVLTFLNIL